MYKNILYIDKLKQFHPVSWGASKYLTGPNRTSPGLTGPNHNPNTTLTLTLALARYFDALGKLHTGSYWYVVWYFCHVI